MHETHRFESTASFGADANYTAVDYQILDAHASVKLELLNDVLGNSGKPREWLDILYYAVKTCSVVGMCISSLDAQRTNDIDFG